MSASKPKRIQRKKYRVIGGAATGCYGVCQVGGGLEYDVIESRREAQIICRLLNEGYGPEWDKIAAHVDREMSAVTR